MWTLLSLMVGCTPTSTEVTPGTTDLPPDGDTDSDSDSDADREQACPEVDPLGFQPSAVIMETAGNAKSPTIVSDGDDVFVAWHDFTHDPTQLYFASQSGSGDWDVELLDLLNEKAIRPRLLTDGASVHLFFDVYEEDEEDWAVYITTRTGQDWSTPERLGSGEKVDPVLHEGNLHAVWFDGMQPIHRWRDGSAWVDGNPLAVPSAVQTFRLRLLSAEDLELVVALSPASLSYDIERFTWDGNDWTSQPLFTSINLSSDDPSGSVGPDGVAQWVWTEQDPADLWTIGIALQRSDATRPTRVNQNPGFSTSPDITVPSDGLALVTWLDDQEQLLMSQAPFDEQVVISTEGAGPRITTDRCGVSHLVYYAHNQAGVQDIYYTSNAVP
jgi:hypothetical protein